MGLLGWAGVMVGGAGRVCCGWVLGRALWPLSVFGEQRLILALKMLRLTQRVVML